MKYLHTAEQNVWFSFFFFFFPLVSCDLPSCLIICLVLWWFNVMLGFYSDPLPYLLVYPHSMYMVYGAAPLLTGPPLVAGGSVTFCGLPSSLATVFCGILSSRFIEGKLVKSLYNNDLVKGVSFFFPSPPHPGK